MDVEVRRSARRRKTVSARVVDGVLQVSIPSWMSKAEEQRWVDEMRRRLGRQEAARQVDLAPRARQLAARYGLEEPSSIRWVDNQATRWGSCTPADRSVRISTRLSRAPGWVLDYVIVHELAHLTRADHSPAFWKLVERYPRAERARGFLLGMAMLGEEPEDDVEATPPPGPALAPEAPEAVAPEAAAQPVPRRTGRSAAADLWPSLPGFEQEQVVRPGEPPAGRATRARRG